MKPRLISPSVNMAVSLDDARNAARANGTDLDSAIEIQVRTITSDAEHAIGRAFIEQTWRVTLDCFPDKIELPAPPVMSVASVKYIDRDGIERTLDPADYMLDAASEPAYILPAPGGAWPATADRINAVNAVVVCGYGPDETTTPPGIKGYILMKVQEFFAPAGTPVLPDLERGLDRFKVY